MILVFFLIHKECWLLLNHMLELSFSEAVLILELLLPSHQIVEVHLKVPGGEADKPELAIPLAH